MIAKEKITCDACGALMEPYLDDALDIASLSLVNAHLEQCPRCAESFQKAETFLGKLRENAPRYELPPDVAGAVMARIRAEHKSSASPLKNSANAGKFWRGSWHAPGLSAAVLALGLVLMFQLSMPSTSGRLADEAVSDHVRSLMENHLTDVISSDKHTVKPWFTGKLDYAPPVADFSAAGYPLVGGRLDYLGYKTVAALSYRHGKHLINVFIMPDDVSDRLPKKETLRGYNIISWTKNRMTFYAVSDMNAEELNALAQLIQNS